MKRLGTTNNKTNVSNTFFSKTETHNQKSGGFTLVEILLYITITATIMGSISVLLQILIESRVKNQTIAEVEQQGSHVVHLMQQTIRNAEGVSSPAQGLTTESLVIDVLSVDNDPTIFDTHNGVFRITEGSFDPVALTNTRVRIATTTFQNFSRTTHATTVRFEFIIEHVNPSNRNEYEYAKTFSGSASVR